MSSSPTVTPTRLNQFVLPENIAHAFLTLLFLLSFQVVALLINAPLVAYHANKCAAPTLAFAAELSTRPG